MAEEKQQKILFAKETVLSLCKTMKKEKKQLSGGRTCKKNTTQEGSRISNAFRAMCQACRAQTGASSCTPGFLISSVCRDVGHCTQLLQKPQATRTSKMYFFYIFM